MSYHAVKSTLGPRGRGRPIAMGADTFTPVQQAIARLQAQINRFITPPIAITGQLDLGTAQHAMTIMLQRFTRAFVEDPANKETARLFAEANRNLGTPIQWVSPRVVEITDTLRDFGDFIGKPPARGQASSSDKVIALALAGVAIAVIASGKRRRR